MNIDIFIPQLMTRRNVFVFLASALTVGLAIGFASGYLYGILARIQDAYHGPG